MSEIYHEVHMTRVLHTRLSNAEVSLLKKGLNFAVTLANIQATEIIANFEKNFDKIISHLRGKETFVISSYF